MHAFMITSHRRCFSDRLPLLTAAEVRNLMPISDKEFASVVNQSHPDVRTWLESRF